MGSKCKDCKVKWAQELGLCRSCATKRIGDKPTSRKPPNGSLARNGSGRCLWSLLDMLQISAHEYVRVGEGFAQIRPMLDNPKDDWFDRNAPIVGRSNYKTFSQTLGDIQHHCAYLQLRVTSGLINRFFERYPDNQIPTVNDCYVFIEGLMNTFKVELDQQVFCYVDPGLTAYYPGDGGSPETAVGAEANALMQSVESFPNAYFDAREAATCFAFERFTAAVYHLMRVAEHGLVSVALKAGAAQDQLRSWDHMLIKVNGKAGKIAEEKAGDWVQERNKWAEIASWFTSIRNGWRNPVSHVPRIYMEGSAKGIFSATCTLFDHLKRHGFVPAPMPVVPIGLPSDPA